MSDDKQKRTSYELNPDAGELTVKFEGEVGVFPLYPDLEAVTGQLALEGLRGYLQRATSGVDESEKLTAINEAFDQLAAEGMKCFEKKPPFSGPRGPKKADKIAALAALKNATVAAVKEVLTNMDQKEQKRVLNNPKVLAKLEEMQSSASELDLSV
jgi:hypothetical protein